MGIEKKPGRSPIERVKEMNKNLPKDAGGKYTLKRSLRNPGGKIKFEQDRRPRRPGLKKGGKVLKPVNKAKNPGLAKLPTKVRNKMGYMKKGGMVKK